MVEKRIFIVLFKQEVGMIAIGDDYCKKLSLTFSIVCLFRISLFC